VSSRQTDVTLITAIAIALLAPVAWRAVRRRFDPFEPIVLFALAYGVMFIVRPSAMLAAGEIVVPGPLRALDVSETFTQMLVLAWLGAMAFVGGYALPFGPRLARSLRPPPEPRNLRRLTLVAAFVAALGVAAFAVFVTSADGLGTLRLLLGGRSVELSEAIGASSKYPLVASFLVLPAAATLVALALRRRTPLVAAAAACSSAFVLLRAVPTGSRALLLVFLGSVLVLYYLRRTSRPSMLFLLVLAAVALTVSTFLSDLRGRADRGESVGDTAANIATDPSRILEPLSRGPDSEMAATLAAALEVIPEKRPFAFGRTIVGDLVVRPVPRTIWEGKPEPPRRALVATIWPVEYGRGSINPEFSVLLYLYWDFWIVGVALGLAFYGVLFRLLYEYFLRNQHVLAMQVFFSLSLWFLVVAVRDSPVDTLAAFSFTALPALAIFAVATRLEGPEPVEREIAASSGTG
jgi:hypothetical protein